MQSITKNGKAKYKLKLREMGYFCSPPLNTLCLAGYKTSPPLIHFLASLVQPQLYSFPKLWLCQAWGWVTSWPAHGQAAITPQHFGEAKDAHVWSHASYLEVAWRYLLTPFFPSHFT